MKKVIKFACLLAVLVMSSCVSRKEMIYLSDMDELHEYPVIQKYEAVIQRPAPHVGQGGHLDISPLQVFLVVFRTHHVEKGVVKGP